MSDLAPFVAATLRDKVVADLLKENEKLQKLDTLVTKSRTVEITGSQGQPVYASGKFDDDGGYANNPNLWEVRLSPQQQQQQQPCPLADLRNVEVRLGGVCKAKFGNNSVVGGYLDPDQDDGDNNKSVHFCFAGSGELWLDIMIDGWPREQWQPLANGHNDAGEMPSYLAEDVASENPRGKTIQFRSVAFMNSTVSGLIQTLSIGPAVEEEAEERGRHHAFMGYVATRMREAGNDEPSGPFIIHTHEMMDALERLDINETNANESEEIISELIRVQMETDDHDTFVDAVERMVREGRS